MPPRRRRSAALIACMLAGLVPVAFARQAQPTPPGAPAQPMQAPLPPAPPPPPMDVAPRYPSVDQVFPVYPGFAALYGFGGRVVLDVTMNAQGAVIDARVEKSSGHLALDRSALAAARRSHFVPGERAGLPVGGVVRVPINFDPLHGNDEIHNHLWPTDYAHPRYVADSTPIGYPSVEAAYEQVPALPHRPLAQAHPIEQLLVTDASGKLVAWWVFTDLRTPDAMATRMRFAGSGAEPVVKVSSLCAQASVCADRASIVLHGPVYARSH